jgi:hypothetical protein
VLWLRKYQAEGVSLLAGPLKVLPVLKKSHESASTADNTGMQARQLLTVKEVTHVLRLARAAIHKRLRNRDLDGLRMGAQGRFRQEAINT